LFDNEVEKLILNIDRYSSAVPCGSAIVAIERFIYDYLTYRQGHIRRQTAQALAKLDNKKNKTADEILEIEKLKNQLKDTAQPPCINVTFTDELEIDSARAWPPDPNSSVNFNTKYFRIALPQKALVRFLNNDNTEVNCPLKSCCEHKNSDHSRCGARNCELRKKLRRNAAHELSHIIDFYFNYTDSLPTADQKEDYHYEVADKLLEARENYLMRGFEIRT